MPKFKKNEENQSFSKEVDSKNLKFCFSFECLGVKIGVRGNSAILNRKLRARLPETLPVRRREIPENEATHWFSIVKDKKSGGESGFEYKIYKESELLRRDSRIDEILNNFESHIRITIAEFAENFVFLHAGVVGWKGKAIVIPGKSFSGKTTLVAELIKRNCEYFSDEYAVIDETGLVHPFAKKLSLRGIINDYQQIDFAVEELGGNRAAEPVPAGYLLITEYNKKIKNPKLKFRSTGEGIMASVANSVSVRRTPQFVLKVLTTFVKEAVVLQTKRGDAREFADLLLNYLEKSEQTAAANGN